MLFPEFKILFTCYFSKLDLKSGYWQVEIDELDNHKTAFQVRNLGFYECNVMLNGMVTNSLF